MKKSLLKNDTSLNGKPAITTASAVRLRDDILRAIERASIDDWVEPRDIVAAGIIQKTLNEVRGGEGLEVPKAVIYIGSFALGAAFGILVGYMTSHMPIIYEYLSA